MRDIRVVAGRAEDRLRSGATETRRDLRRELRRGRAAEVDAQSRWRPTSLLPGRPTGGRSPSVATATRVYVMNADGSGQRSLTRNPACDAQSGLVAGRAEDRLLEPARRQPRGLRHERRRQRAAEPDAQPVARRLLCLVARAEEVAASLSFLPAPFSSRSSSRSWSWPREESNLRAQIRSSARTQIGRDTPRRFRLPEPFLLDRRLRDLGPSRWVWWPHGGPTERASE